MIERDVKVKIMKIQNLIKIFFFKIFLLNFKKLVLPNKLPQQAEFWYVIQLLLLNKMIFFDINKI